MVNTGNLNVPSTTNIRLDSGEELIAMVKMARKAVKILGQRLNVAHGKFKTLEDFTLEETDSIS